MLFFLLRGTPRAVLLRAGLMIALIAFADWRVEVNIPLGFLYLFPMLLVGSVLKRWQIAAVAALCTFLTEIFDSYAWFPAAGVTRDILIFAAFLGMGLFVYELVRSRQTALQHVQQIESEMQARREAEEQLKVLVESSPAAIFTTNSDGVVLLANDAAHRMLALDPGALPGRSIRDYLPALMNVPAPDHNRPSFRTAMQCRGRTQDGQAFLADIWFSTYRTSAGSAPGGDGGGQLRRSANRAKNSTCINSWPARASWWARCRMRSAMYAVRSPWCIRIWRAAVPGAEQGFRSAGHADSWRSKRSPPWSCGRPPNPAAGLDLPSLLEELRIIVEPPLARARHPSSQWSIAAGAPATFGRTGKA